MKKFRVLVEAKDVGRADPGPGKKLGEFDDALNPRVKIADWSCCPTLDISRADILPERC